MTNAVLHEKHKLEDYFYLHKGEDFIHDGFLFVEGEYYGVSESEAGMWIIDDNGNSHDVYAKGMYEKLHNYYVD